MISISIDNQDPDLLCVIFRDISANTFIEQVPGRRWSYSRRCWLVPNTRESVIRIGQLFGKENCQFSPEVIRLYKSQATIEEINRYLNPPNKQSWKYKPKNTEADNHPTIQQVVRELQIRNYSHKTIGNYKSCLIKLIHFVQDRPLHEVTDDEFKAFLQYLSAKRRLSGSSVNVYLNAFKFYREKVLGWEARRFDIAYSKTPQRLPQVFSKDEVKAIIDHTRSLKYKTVFRTIYAAGLRVSEAAGLRLSDIDTHRKLIRIKNGKGQKDRFVMLSTQLASFIAEYRQTYHPRQWLFENSDIGEPLAVRTIQAVFADAAISAGIRKRAGIHTLRHSFATHLLEAGTDIRYIQELMGHADIQTTMRYTHVNIEHISTIKSPFDDL